MFVNKDDLRQVIAEAMNEKNISSDREDDGYYTTAEMCKLLHITRVTLWRLCKDGIIRGVKVGKKNLYQKKYINELIAAGKLG